VTTQDSFFSIGQNTFDDRFFEVYKASTDEAVTNGPQVYAQLSFSIDYDVVIKNRSIYSALDWLGDVGGLFDALLILLQILVGLFYSDVFRYHLVSSFFSLQESAKQSLGPQPRIQLASENLKGRKDFNEPAFKVILYKVLWCLKRKASERLIERGEKFLDKQIDVVTLIKRQLRIETLLKYMTPSLHWKLASYSKKLVLDNHCSTQGSSSENPDKLLL